MSLFNIVFAGLMGFFAFAAIYHFVMWLCYRREVGLFIFAMDCSLRSVQSYLIVLLANTSVIDDANRYYSVRIALSLLVAPTVLWNITLFTGIKARWFVWPATVIYLTGFLIHTLLTPLNASVIELRPVTLFWGEQVMASVLGPQGWYFVPLHLVAVGGGVLALGGGIKLWSHDRFAAVLVWLMGVGIVIVNAVAIFQGLGRIVIPFVAVIPQVFWVCALSIMFARQHQKTRRLLVASEQRFRGIFDGTFELLGLLTTEGRILEANRTSLESAGVHAQEVVGKLFWETPWWAHSLPLQQQLQQAIHDAAQGETVRFEATHPQPNGDVIVVDFSLKPIRDEAGNVILLIPEGRDITERRDAETTIQQILEGVAPTTGQDFFVSLVNLLARTCSSDFAFIGRIEPSRCQTVDTLAVSHSGAIVANFSYELQHTPCERLLKSDFCYFPDDIQRLFPQDISLADMNVHSYMGIALRSNTGQMLGLIGLLHQHSFRRSRQVEAVLRVVAVRAAAELERVIAETAKAAAEQSLREQETFLRLTQEAAHVGSWEWDIVHHRCKWSDEMARMHGITAAEFDGSLEMLLSFRSEQAREQMQRDLALAIQSGDMQPYENRIRRRDGQERDLWFLGQIERNPQGEPTRILGVTIDITERKQAEESRRLLEAQLAQAQKMEAIGQLAGGVAHDFNNLLTIINGYGQILLLNIRPDEPTYSMLEDVMLACERGASLTRQLLTFTRRQVIEPRPLDLNRVVVETEKLLRRLLREDIQLVSRLEEGLGWVIADPGQISQVLINLAVNARDAMPNGGQLTITTQSFAVKPSTNASRRTPHAALTVTDTGTGMTPDVLAHIFEPFFTTKVVGKGTGLGLATVRAIVEQCGGYLEVDSAVGAGSSFRMILPVHQADSAPDANPASESSEGSAGSETILLVEDEDTVRHMIRYSLEQYGYIVLEAANGTEAIRLFDTYRSPIDILVTDVVMPDLGGRELASRLLKRAPQLSVVYISGYTDDEVLRRGIAKSDVAFLQKPFSVGVLAKKIRQLRTPKNLSFTP